MTLRIAFLLILLAAAGCTTTRKLYDGPDRDPAEVVVLQARNSYVFSVNGRRTDHAKEPRAQLLLLPGTQQLIVHLDDKMASQYGRVGVRTTFCAAAGHTYTVYPLPDMIARLWEPAVRDEATGQDVSPRPCVAAAGSPPPEPVAAPPAAIPAPAPAAPPVATPPAAAPPLAVQPAPPAAKPVPPPVAAPAVPPPPPGVMAPGAQARLKAVARTRSLPDAPPAKGLEAGATVTLKVVLKKDTGPWWYVTSPAGSGWVREAELELATP